MTALTSSKSLLGRSLLLDGVVSGATGALMFLAVTPQAHLLGLHERLLRLAGFSLLPFSRRWPSRASPACSTWGCGAAAW